MTKINTPEEALKKLKARRKYMNEYMRKKRANGIHKKVPKYIRKQTKESIDMSFDARALYDASRTCERLRQEEYKSFRKGQAKLWKTIEDQAVQLRFNVDLIRKFKQAQEATMEKLIDADAEIAELQHRIQKLVNEKLN